MRHEIYFDVFGEPAPQGSKRHVGNGVMIESSKKVGPWRIAVAEAIAEAVAASGDPSQFDSAVEVWAVYHLTRPTSVKRIWPIKPPDLDKLERGLWDAITKTGLWADDSLVVRSHPVKVYADTRRPGASVLIRRVEDFPLSSGLI